MLDGVLFLFVGNKQLSYKPDQLSNEQPTKIDQVGEEETEHFADGKKGLADPARQLITFLTLPGRTSLCSPISPDFSILYALICPCSTGACDRDEPMTAGAVELQFIISTK